MNKWSRTVFRHVIPTLEIKAFDLKVTNWLLFSLLIAKKKSIENSNLIEKLTINGFLSTKVVTTIDRKISS